VGRVLPRVATRYPTGGRTNVFIVLLRLPERMLSRPGPLPSGSGPSYEVKRDGRSVGGTDSCMRSRAPAARSIA
jgi:hypothetical protein